MYGGGGGGGGSCTGAGAGASEGLKEEGTSLWRGEASERGAQANRGDEGGGLLCIYLSFVVRINEQPFIGVGGGGSFLSGGGGPAAADRAFQMIRPASFATGPTANKAHERREERGRDGTGLFPGGPLPRGVPRPAPSTQPKQASPTEKRERSSASERESKTKGKETTSMDPIRFPFRPACFAFYFLLVLACSAVSRPCSLRHACPPSHMNPPSYFPFFTRP